jgi:AAA family ATP:ADP antiporter
MKDRLFKLLGIEHGEESMVSMLLTQSVFLGIFYGAFDISAHSLFLAIFDEKMMARAYVVSGFAGILLTALYTWLQARVRFRNFAIINLIFVTGITIMLWIALLLNPSRWIIFFVFVLLGPLNILAMLGFWGTTGRLFSLRQGKRLFGLVDAGLIIGIIISCYAIPLLLSLNFKSHNILLLSAGSIFVAAFVQVLIGNRFTFVAGKDRSSEKKRPGLSIFRKDSYIRIMGIFIALSVMTAFFVQYSFMAVTREQYPAEADMARFLGLFTGSMMIFTLLIKILAFSYLIRNYGLKTCLAIAPYLVAGLTVIALGIGIVLGYTPAATTGFLLFFLLMALSRLFSKALKDSIESPSFKVIYQTVDEKIRYEVQSGIDGTINEIAALSSGLLLAGLGALTFVKLIHFSFVLFGIILLWIFFAIKLYQEYRKSIRESLEAVGSENDSDTHMGSFSDLKSRVAGRILFRSEYFNIIRGDSAFIDATQNKWFINNILEQAEKKMDINLLPALRKISASGSTDEMIRYKAADLIDQLESLKGDYQKLVRILIKTEDEKVVNARKLVAGQRLPQTTEILRLLRDNNPESKRYAIYLIGKFRLIDMLPEVCDCLSIPGLETDAVSVIGSFGSEASGELQRRYMSSSGNIFISKIILRLLSLSCTPENSVFMFNRLWSNSRQIKETAIKCLADCGFKADAEEMDKINQLASETIGMITWNISAQVTLAQNNDLELLEVMRKETAGWNHFLFNLLSLAYDPGSLAKIRANIESGTVESVNYALEMIDIVIDESIKAKFVSLIDSLSDEEKLKNLHQFFPGELPQYGQLIEDILNRDYNYISIWARAYTMRHLVTIDNNNIRDSVVALLFSPEKILQEEAAFLLSKADKNVYYEAAYRLERSTGQLTGKIISGEIMQEEFLLERVSFLSGLFTDIPEDELLFLAELIIYKSASEFQSTKEIPDSIIWNIESDFSSYNMAELFENNIAGYLDTNTVFAGSFFYIIPVEAIEDFRNLYPERSYEVFIYFDKQISNKI